MATFTSTTQPLDPPPPLVILCNLLKSQAYLIHNFKLIKILFNSVYWRGSKCFIKSMCIRPVRHGMNSFQVCWEGITFLTFYEHKAKKNHSTNSAYQALSILEIIDCKQTLFSSKIFEGKRKTMQVSVRAWRDAYFFGVLPHGFSRKRYTARSLGK